MNIGSPHVTSFYTNILDQNIIDSTWNQYPTKENPKSRYKFTSCLLARDPDFGQIFRKTDSIIDVLASIGGLMRALFFIGSMIISPFSEHAL